MTSYLNILKLRFVSPLILLLPISIVIQRYAPNMHRLSFEHFLTSTLFITLGFLIFRIIIGAFVKEKLLADMLSACLFVGVFMAGFANFYFALAWFLIWFMLSFFIFFWRKIIEPLKFSIYFLVANSIVPLFIYFGHVPGILNRADLSNKFSSEFVEFNVNDTSSLKRDIYYIVMDRYAQK